MADVTPPAVVPPAGQPPEAPKRAFAKFQFVIEFSTPQNNVTLCPITRHRYRGEWTSAALRNRVPDDRFSRMPDLPGHRIAYDGAGRRLEIIDPLDTKEYRDILTAAQEVMREMGWAGDEPDEKRTYTDLTDHMLKNWLYWCRRWLDAEQVKVIRGEANLPEMDVILDLPGQIEHNQFDLPGRRDKHPDQRERPPYQKPLKPAPVRLKKRKSRRRDRDED